MFRSHFKLIANCPATGQTKEAKLGGDYHWRKNGTFWVDYRDVKKPYDLQFPQACVFTYHLEGNDETLKLTFNNKQTL